MNSLEDELLILYQVLLSANPKQPLHEITHSLLVACNYMDFITFGQPPDEVFIDKKTKVKKWKGHSPQEKFVVIDQKHKLYFNQTVQELMDVCYPYVSSFLP